MTDIRAPEVSTKFVTFLCMTFMQWLSTKSQGPCFSEKQYIYSAMFD